MGVPHWPRCWPQTRTLRVQCTCVCCTTWWAVFRVKTPGVKTLKPLLHDLVGSAAQLGSRVCGGSITQKSAVGGAQGSPRMGSGRVCAGAVVDVVGRGAIFHGVAGAAGSRGWLRAGPLGVRVGGLAGSHLIGWR